MTKKTICMFCNKKIEKNQKAFANDNIDQNPTLICLNCIEICYNTNIQTNVDTNIKLHKPSTIVKKVSNKVFGQTEALKKLSVVFYNHFKRFIFKELHAQNYKSHTLLIGPSGCGKTMMVTEIAKAFNVPYVVIDSTTLTASGYAGDDVEQCIYHLYENTNKDIKKTEQGIIFVDEFDKSSEQDIHGRDIRGKEVQFNFLKLLDGKDVYIKNKKNILSNDEVVINTSNILFIFGGCFDGLYDKLKQDNNSLGLINTKNTTYNDIIKSVNSESIINYGIIPEITGRISNYITCRSLNYKDLMVILKNDIIPQYQSLLKIDKTTLKFTDEAILKIAQMNNNKCGARNLKNILDNLLSDILYESPENKKNITITINTNYINNHFKQKLTTKKYNN